MKNQWRGREQIKQIQELKLKRLVKEAYLNVPYYRNLFESIGLLPEDINSVEDLSKIPLTRKAELQKFNKNYLTNKRFHCHALKSEHTSGSTGEPFTVYYDPDFVITRNMLFLRALRSAGYKITQRILLITDEKPDQKKVTPPGWYYTSILDSPDQLLRKLNNVKPDYLYGSRTPLKLIAELIHSTNFPVYYPKKIISTAETLDQSTRAFLENTFNAELYEFYGLTEMGIVGWECAEHNGLHLAEDSTIVEYLPVGNGNGSRLVMTNLNLMAMPFIRFETGDIVYSGGGKLCPCGRKATILKRIEGRISDCVKLKNGQILSPYRLTCAIEKLRGIKNYQVTQIDYDIFTVKVETGRNGIDTSENEISEVIRSIIGNGVRISIQKNDKFDIKPGRKFRVVESRVR